MAMARFKLEIEYEGTRYSGWQVQKHVRTVQGELLEAIKRILPEREIVLQGAGRTDAGVHALCQVAHLDCDMRIPPDVLRLKINDELPADIHVLHLEPAPKNFHARHSAVARSYIYQISQRRTAFGKTLRVVGKGCIRHRSDAKSGGTVCGFEKFRILYSR